MVISKYLSKLKTTADRAYGEVMSIPNKKQKLKSAAPFAGLVVLLLLSGTLFVNALNNVNQELADANAQVQRLQADNSDMMAENAVLGMQVEEREVDLTRKNQEIQSLKNVNDDLSETVVAYAEAEQEAAEAERKAQLEEEQQKKKKQDDCGWWWCN